MFGEVVKNEYLCKDKIRVSYGRINQTDIASQTTGRAGR